MRSALIGYQKIIPNRMPKEQVGREWDKELEILIMVKRRYN